MLMNSITTSLHQKPWKYPYDDFFERDNIYTGDVVIPSRVENNSITYSGKDVLYYCTSLTSVEIPSSVTSINGTAFASCTSLTSKVIPNSVTSIGMTVFGNYKYVFF